MKMFMMMKINTKMSLLQSKT